MSYSVTHRYGEMEAGVPSEHFVAILAELDENDNEHPNVALVDESGWALSAYQSGLLVWEHLDRRNPRHMKNVSREKILKLWKQLASGDHISIEKEAWLPGYR